MSKTFEFPRHSEVRTIRDMAELSVTTDELRKDLPTLLDKVRWRGLALRIRRYKTPLAVVVPVDWYERAVAAIGEPTEPEPAGNPTSEPA